MFQRVLVASVLVIAASVSSEARPLHTSPPKECNVIMPCDFSFAQSQGPKMVRVARRAQLSQSYAMGSVRSVPSEASVGTGQVVGGRPAGCPRSFCGCGAAIRVFGRIVPELNLASNWLRFPRATPAPGMVAARRGHVFVLEQHVGGDVWMAYDANSGGHATRIHARSLHGYAIVNPHV
ncbi:MAG: hypothetical protein KGM94_05870 [Bradyrhizobium sp.]|nr:hypothetical protein [Bradyrhizobium sp.]